MDNDKSGADHGPRVYVLLIILLVLQIAELIVDLYPFYVRYLFSPI